MAYLLHAARGLVYDTGRATPPLSMRPFTTEAGGCHDTWMHTTETKPRSAPKQNLFQARSAEARTASCSCKTGEDWDPRSPGFTGEFSSTSRHLSCSGSELPACQSKSAREVVFRFRNLGFTSPEPDSIALVVN